MIRPIDPYSECYIFEKREKDDEYGNNELYIFLN